MIQIRYFYFQRILSFSSLLSRSFHFHCNTLVTLSWGIQCSFKLYTTPIHIWFPQQQQRNVEKIALLSNQEAFMMRAASRLLEYTTFHNGFVWASFYIIVNKIILQARVGCIKCSDLRHQQSVYATICVRCLSQRVRKSHDEKWKIFQRVAKGTWLMMFNLNWKYVSLLWMRLIRKSATDFLVRQTNRIN